MIQRFKTKLSNWAPYWYIILLFYSFFLSLFIYHLATGKTPNREALTIGIFDDFPIYWYGIIIIGGVFLGTYVTTHLAMERASVTFIKSVPTAVRQRKLDTLPLPEPLLKHLQSKGYQTVGELLFQWGLHPDRLRLKKQATMEVFTALEADPGVKTEWANDPSWRVWNPEYAWGGVIWCLLIAIVGARLYHVLVPSPSNSYSTADYFSHPMQLVNLRDGGLGIYGGIAGGALGLLWYTYRNRLPTLGWADLGVVGVALGQAFGRWGNFFNQELYGAPSDLPWAITIEPTHRLESYVDVARYHPAFLYESLWNLLAFFVLYRLARRHQASLRTGDLTALYLIFYAVGRILLELVRLDSRTVTIGSFETGLPVATLVSIAVALPLGLLLIRRHVWTGRRS